MALPAEDQALRSELSEARFTIQRQLEVLRTSPGAWGRAGNREIVRILQAQLAEIEQELAGLADEG